MEDRFLVTRTALHRVVEHVLAAARYAETGRIGLQVIDGGFSTGPFGPGPTVVSVLGDLLVIRQGNEQRSARLTTLGDATALVGIEAGIPETVYRPATDRDPASPISVDLHEAARIQTWYRQVSTALTAFVSEVVPEEPATASPTVQTLWPEHFDVAIRVDDVNYGGLAGDESVTEPYVYVGPTGPAPLRGAFWNQPFGAVRTWSEVTSVEAIVAFFAEGRRHSGQITADVRAATPH